MLQEQEFVVVAEKLHIQKVRSIFNLFQTHFTKGQRFKCYVAPEDLDATGFKKATVTGILDPEKYVTLIYKGKARAIPARRAG